MNKLNKFTICGTIVGITSTTKRTVLNIATKSHSRNNDTTFLLVRFDRKVDVCGFSVKENVVIEGTFSKGFLIGTSISYLPRPLDKYKDEFGKELSYKPTFITDRKNEIVVSGIIDNIQHVENTPFTYVNVFCNDSIVKVTFVGNTKELEVGREVAVVGYLQAYETAKNKYSIVAINVIDYQLFDMTDYKAKPEADIEPSEPFNDDSGEFTHKGNEDGLNSESEEDIPNPFEF